MAKEVLYNQELIERLPASFLVVITGPTASGKDFTITALEQCIPNMKRVNSVTTRPAEQYGGQSDYEHTDPDSFFRLGKGLVAVTSRIIDGTEYYYGTRTESLDILTNQDHRLAWKLDIATAATLPIILSNAFESTKAIAILEKTAVICLGYPSLQTVRQRYFARNRNDSQRGRFRLRLQDEWQMWQKYKTNFDYVVLNSGTSEQTVNNIVEIISGVNASNLHP